MSQVSLALVFRHTSTKQRFPRLATATRDKSSGEARPGSRILVSRLIGLSVTWQAEVRASDVGTLISNSTNQMRVARDLFPNMLKRPDKAAPNSTAFFSHPISIPLTLAPGRGHHGVYNHRNGLG